MAGLWENLMWEAPCSPRYALLDHDILEKEVRSMFGDCTHPSLVLEQMREDAHIRRHALKRKVHHDCDCVNRSARNQSRIARGRVRSEHLVIVLATKAKLKEASNHGENCVCNGALSKNVCLGITDTAHARATKEDVASKHGKGCACDGRLSKIICLAIRARIPR